MSAPSEMNVYALLSILERGDAAIFAESYDAWTNHDRARVSDPSPEGFLRIISRMALEQAGPAALDFLAAKGSELLTGPEPASQTLAHIAVGKHNVAALRWLRDQGRPIDTPNDVGLTPLALACSMRVGELVSELLTMGADPNGTAYSGQPGKRYDCLTLSVSSRARPFGEAEIGGLILAAGARRGHMPDNGQACALAHSISCADPAVFDMMFSAVMALSPALRQPALDQTLVHAAQYCAGSGPNLQSGYPAGRMFKIVDKLLKAGANPLAPHATGCSPETHNALSASVGGDAESQKTFKRILADIPATSRAEAIIGKPCNSALLSAAARWKAPQLKTLLALIPLSLDIDAPHDETALAMAVCHNGDPLAIGELLPRSSLRGMGGAHPAAAPLSLFDLALARSNSLAICSTLAHARCERAGLSIPFDEVAAAMRQAMAEPTPELQSGAMQGWIASREQAGALDAIAAAPSRRSAPTRRV